MSREIDDRRRRVVPRWRPFAIAAAIGEIEPTRATTEPPTLLVPADELADVLGNWNRDHTPSSASDLLDLAIVSMNNELAIEAAQWIAVNGGLSSVSVDLAKSFLGSRGTEAGTDPLRVKALQRFERIARYRRALRIAPHDAIAWTDLALEHATLGNTEAAKRAIRIATSLASQSRFVLRSACRLHLHVGEPDVAHRLLERDGTVRRDPWLMAAEIVAAEAAGVPARSVKRGRQALQGGSFGDHHLSELAAAMGTLEYLDGSMRAAKKHFRQSLVLPTENAVAQAAWFSRHTTGQPLLEVAYSVPLAFEAEALRAVRSSRLVDAAKAAQQWQNDEPFASRPAELGAWVAAVGLGDHGLALDVLAIAERSNPTNLGVLALRFYSEASNDQLDVATKTLQVLEARRHEKVWTPGYSEVLIEADRGLLAFRRGNIAEGVTHYRKAISGASDPSLRTARALATLNLAFEAARVRLQTDIDDATLEQFVEVFDSTNREVVRAFVARIRSLRQVLPGSAVPRDRSK